MKKKVNEDKMLELSAQKYFSDDFSELEPNRINKLKNKVSANKTTRKNIWIKFLSIATTMCCVIVLCVVLPLTLKQKPLYTYTDLTRIEIPVEDSRDYIDEYYPEYSFIFDDCNILVSYGQYADDELCILGLSGTKKDIPFTYVEFTLIINQAIDYPEKDTYVTGAEVVQNERYTLYKKVIQNLQNQVLCTLLDYKDYDLYLKFDIDDEDLLNKFL